MLQGLDSAAAGMIAQQRRMDAVANDLANSSTPGYKRMRVAFRDLMSSAATATAPASTAGVAADDMGRSFEQGMLQKTDQPLDVALQGEGFLRVRLANGQIGLTRDGSLRLDESGQLMASGGAMIEPPLKLPAGTSAEKVTIEPDGSVLVNRKKVGQLSIDTVPAPQNLLSVGDNMFAPTAASGAPRSAPSATTVTQRSIETSNVDLGGAMVEMIESQRSYQLASRAIQMADQMLEIANGVKR